MPALVVTSGSLVERAEQFAHALDFEPRALENASRAFVRHAFPPTTSKNRVQTQRASDMARALTRSYARALWTQANACVTGFEAAHRQFGVTLQEKFGSDLHQHADAALAPDVIGLARTLPGLNRAPAGPLGCTTLAIVAKATAAQSLLFGRAHDLAGGAPHETKFVLHVPKSGWAHVSLHPGGAFLPGFSAVNERGLCVGIHPATTRATNKNGTPLAALAIDLIEHASSLDDAIARLTRARAATGASFALACGERAAVVEVDGHGPGAVLFPPRIHLAVGAPLRTRKNAHAFSGSELERERSWAHLARLNALARSTTRHTPATVARALGNDTDAYDPARKRAFGNTVFDLSQVGAFVVEPKSKTLFIAHGDARAELWTRLDLDATFAQATPVRTALDAHPHYADDPLVVDIDRAANMVEQPRFAAPVRVSEAREHARRHHQEAARLLTLRDDDDDDGAITRAAKLLGQAIDLDSTESLHHLARALIATRQHEHEVVRMRCEHVLENETSPYRRGLACFLSARANLLAGKPAEATRQKERGRMELDSAHPQLLERILSLTARRAKRALAYNPVAADAPRS